MVIRSVGWLIWIFVAVTTASNYREPASITEWSGMESGQKFEEMAGNTHLVVDRATVAARSPTSATRLEHRVMGASSGLEAVPDAEDPMMRQLLAVPHTLQAHQVSNMAPQLSKMAPQLPNMAPHLPEMAPGLLSSPGTDGVANLQPDCRKHNMSAETAVATALGAMKLLCDSQRQAAVVFIKDHLGQVLASQGWVDAVRTQPEDVVQLSRLLAEQLAATSTPARPHTTVSTTTSTMTSTTTSTTTSTSGGTRSTTTSTTTSTATSTTTSTTTTTTRTTAQPQSDRSHNPTATVPPAVTCPTSPLDEDIISSLRILPEEEKGRKLIEAAKKGEVEGLRILLVAGALPGVSDTHRMTALQWAAWRGHAEVARCLLDAGADVETTDDEEYRPLHRAAMGGHAAMVRMLASVGADPDAKDVWGWTPLHLTVRDHRPEAALALLESGANKEVRNKSGFTPLIMARKGDNQPLIDILTQN